MSTSLEIVIPVYNEVQQLEDSVRTLVAFLDGIKPWAWHIVIADNASTDGTGDRANAIAHRLKCVSVVRLGQKGRGGALRTAWTKSQAEILTYMDVDLSTDLSAFGCLVKAVATGGFDLAVGSRLLPASEVRRGWKREFISFWYNRLIRAVFDSRFSDAQCGFKAISRTAARALLPQVESNGWFFDTELLVLAEKGGYRICDIPVRWTEDPDSRVRIVRTIVEDLKGLIRLRRAMKDGVDQYGQQIRRPLSPVAPAPDTPPT